jgi:uncharacterized protein DUF6600
MEGSAVSIRRTFAVGVLVTLALAEGACTATAGAVSPRRPAQVAVDVGIFYDELAAYGDWVREPEYGWVWIPTDVPVGWRPYTNGYWGAASAER